MALIDLTRQFAQQALGNQVKDVLESLRPPDLPKISEALQPAKPAGPAQPENLGRTILGQLQAIQKALKEDEELLVLFHAGAETIRVLEIFVPAWNVAVITGIDTEKNSTRVISPFESVQFVCKPVKLQPPVKATRVGFIVPKPKAE